MTCAHTKQRQMSEYCHQPQPAIHTHTHKQPTLHRSSSSTHSKPFSKPIIIAPTNGTAAMTIFPASYSKHARLLREALL